MTTIHAFEHPHAKVPMPLDRREFIRRSISAGAAVSLGDLDRLILRVGPGQLSPGGARAKVLILGAGLAGLAAADELIRAGHDVTVLEAQLHPGGRARTIRAPFADGLHAEAGAARFPHAHILTNKYVERFQLSTAPFDPVAPMLLYIGGRVFRSDDKQLFKKLGLTEEEQRLGPDGMTAKYVAPLRQRVGNLEASDFPSRSALELGDMSATDMLRGAGLSNALIAYFDCGFGELHKLSGVNALMDLDSFLPPKFRIRGGTDLLPAALARSIGPAIHYGSPVVEVRQDDQGVTAVVQRAGTDTEYSADYVICTIPLSVLRAQRLIPKLSPAKEDLIRGWTYDDVTRVYIQTTERFWLRAGLSGFAATDHPLEIWDATAGQPGRRGILMTYLYGDRAVEVAALSEEGRVAYAMKSIADVFPEVHRYFDGAVTHAWSDDPWARGAFTIYEPGQFRKYYREIQTPEGRLYFAGEHASPWPGWMQGALHSGLRVARQLQQRVTS